VSADGAAALAMIAAMVAIPVWMILLASGGRKPGAEPPPPMRTTGPTAAGVTITRAGTLVSIHIPHADEYAAMETFDRIEACSRSGGAYTVEITQ
jgi:hypothetical protein